MTRGEIERVVCDVVVAETDAVVSRFGLDAAPITVFGDSLALLFVVLAIEEHLGIDFGDDVMRVQTVGDLARAAERAMAGKARAT